MPVVINDFQVVAEAPAERSAGDGGGEGGRPSPPDTVDAAALAHALRDHQVRALRVWAH